MDHCPPRAVLTRSSSGWQAPDDSHIPNHRDPFKEWKMFINIINDGKEGPLL